MKPTNDEPRKRTGVRHRRLGVVLAGAIVALPLLTGCGMSRSGSAATVDGRTLSVSTVQTQTAGYFDKYSVNDDTCTSTAKVAAMQVENFIRALVAGRAAQQHDVVVSPADVDKFISSSGGIGTIEGAMAQRCLPPDPQLANVEVRSFLQQQAILATAPAGADEFEVGKTLTDALTAASKSMDITVNPRYGAWNDNIVAVSNGSVSVPQEQLNMPAPSAPAPGSGG